MTVEYTKRAVADLRSIAAYYEGLGIAGLGDRIAARFDEVIVHIATRPQSGRQVPTRPGARVASVLRYPYLIYYETPELGVVQILHIRHTSQLPWSGE
ncbi:MAG TPA: type II toxin-antitoxin system RelE/ParE family toxin [Stellaceae bacterium]|jgi:plasmid stabilization system protein ParE|nr:type II toxin-antitoxin system RelE/ParE family toxin [Stellaceae bacterium]